MFDKSQGHVSASNVRPLTDVVHGALIEAHERVRRVNSQLIDKHHAVFGPVPPSGTGASAPGSGNIREASPETIEGSILSLLQSVHEAVGDLEHFSASLLQRV